MTQLPEIDVALNFKRQAMAALLAQSKAVVMERFNFTRSVEIMRKISFGWVAARHGKTEEALIEEAREMLSDLIDSATEMALDRFCDPDSLFNDEHVTFTATGGFSVYITHCGTIRAFFAPEDADNWDAPELAQLFDQHDRHCRRVAQLEASKHVPRAKPAPPPPLVPPRSRRLMHIDDK